MNPTPPKKTLPTEAFDCDTTTAAPDVQAWMTDIVAEAQRGGLDLKRLCAQTKTATKAEAPSLMQQVHDAAAVLFFHWSRFCEDEESVGTLAVARLFNGLTRDARFLHNKFDLIDTSHLDQLKAILESMTFGDGFEPTGIAPHMAAAAKAHTHERAWPWVVLPTFARQPYGRILLFSAEIPNFPHPIFVTQPFFLTGRATLFHTHGQNWAYSAPLGDCVNTHVNTLWTPGSAETPFPLTLEDHTDYCCGDVAIVPPRLIHGIARKRCQSSLPQSTTITDLLRDPERCQSTIGQCRFGEQACLHVYCPDLSLSQHLADCPLVQEDTQFFIEYDMIVFDHSAEQIWCGGGGSWPRRMIEFGTTGEHCGACFTEHDPRKENLDPTTVHEWFVADPAPSLIKYSVESGG